MIGYMLSRVRKDKNVGKAELSRRTGINIGHISHIENEERNPSHRALRSICRALEVPYQPLMYTYDKIFTQEQKNIEMDKHISYDKVLAVSSLDDFVQCPLDLPSASLAVKITDDSMEPMLEKDSYAFIEFNSPLGNKDIGIFEYNGEIMIRRFIIMKNNLVLQADNKNFFDITLDLDSNYSIIAKVIGTSTGLIF